jgi:hypothetical protein
MPKTHNTYYVCLRCGFREHRKRPRTCDQPVYIIDHFSGDLIYRPTDDKCSGCNCRNSLRYFNDATEGRNGKERSGGWDDTGSFDPWNGREICAM